MMYTRHMSHELHTRVAAAGSRMQCAPHAFTASHVITPAAQGRRLRRRRSHRPGQAAQHGMNVVCDKGKQEQRKRGTRNRGTRHTSHVTRHTSHVTRHTSHVTRHTSHVTRHTSHVTRHLLTKSMSGDFDGRGSAAPWANVRV